MSRQDDALDTLAAAAPLPVTESGGVLAKDPAATGVTGTGEPVRSNRVKWFAERYALIGVWLIMAALFGILEPSKFLQVGTFQSLLGSQSSLVFLAAAALCTLIVGEFDLSFAGIMGLSATLVTVLSGLHSVPIALSCLIALAASAGCGLFNAFFVIRLGVSSLVVTLGSASLFLGISELISHSNTVSVTSNSFTSLVQTQLLGLPLAFYYGLALCIVFAYVLSWTPFGRHVVFVGANRDVARLAGVRVDLIRTVAYVGGALLAGLAGVILVATVGGFDPTGAAGYLLPALAAVFLGTAIVTPGQFNPFGTFLGIYFLETGVIGLQLLGASGWAQDAFYGGGLIAAVAVATIVRERTKAR